jgi:hypothetical protein
MREATYRDFPLAKRKMISRGRFSPPFPMGVIRYGPWARGAGPARGCGGWNRTSLCASRSRRFVAVVDPRLLVTPQHPADRVRYLP